ncbi:DUF3617 domain-containing protein [Tsuneonella sp. HG222]
MHRLALLAALPVALAACSDGGADSDADGRITQGEATAEMEQGPDIALQPGQWEQSVSFTEIEMPGAPEALKQMMQQSMTATITSDTCLAPGDVERPGAGFFAGEGNGECTYEEFDRTGNHLKMRMTCAEGDASNTIAMEGDIGEAEYAFDLTTTVNGAPQGPMTMKGKIAARRVGECAS